MPLSPAPPPPAAPVAVGLASEIVEAYNSQRSKTGLAPLAPDGMLTAVAQARAQDMAARGYFGHTSPTGETVFSMLAARGYVGAAAENLARNSESGSASISMAMSGWLSSAGHAGNIVNASFGRIGVAVSSAGGMTTFVVVLAT